MEMRWDSVNSQDFTSWNFHPDLSKEKLPGWAQQSKPMGIHGNPCFPGKVLGASGDDGSPAADPELRWPLRFCGSLAALDLHTTGIK